MSADATPRSRRGRELAALLLAALVFLGLGLGVRDLWNPNEPTYGRVVVEMVTGGDWLIPRLNGEPFVEKPILYYWLAAATSKLMGGVSEVSLRLPVLLAGVLGVWLVYLLIVPYDGHRRALVGGALFATCYGVWFASRNAQMDSFVVLSTLAVVIPLTRRLDHDLPGWKAWLLAGIGGGLGFAAKGPVAVVVPGMVVVVYTVVGRRPWRRLLSGLPLGALVFLVCAGPWYLALYLAGATDALYEVLIRQNFSRFVAAWDHVKPWYYYLEYFWLTFAPWSWFVPIVAVGAVRRHDREAARGRLLAWVWLLVPLLFFSLSESKREPYMLPIAPAVAWLVCGLFDRLLRGETAPWQRRAAVGVSAAIGVVFLLGGAAVLYPGVVEAEGFEAAVGAVGAALLLLGAMILATLVRSRTRRRGPVAVLAAFVLLYCFLALYAHRAANPLKSHRPIARELERRLPEDGTLYSYFGGFRVVRGGYPFYLGRSVPDLPDPERLRAAWRSAERPCVLYEEEKYRRLIEGLPGATELYEGEVGGNTVRLVCAERRGAERAPGEAS